MDAVVDKHHVLAAVHKVQNRLCGVTVRLEEQTMTETQLQQAEKYCDAKLTR